MTERRLTDGSPEPLGVTLDADGINIAVFSANATAIELCLFDEKGEEEVERVLLPARTDNVFHGHIGGIAIGARYGLRAYGPFEPAKGHRFNPSKLLIDPYATSLDRSLVLHASMFDWPPGSPSGGPPSQVDSAPFMPKAIIEPAAPPTELAPPVAGWEGQVVYEMHVRGFSKLNSSIPENVRGTFAALKEPAALDHIRRLGVSAVEIMPASGWIEERHLPPLGLTNYWGYNPVTYMAPDPRLAPGGFAEIRASVDALAEAGVAAILDVVYNHTGEGDTVGPTLSLRGLDHATYYRLDPRAPDGMVNDTGTGNSLAVDRPIVLRLVMDSLRLWARRCGLAGFRFDLATTVSRTATGFDPSTAFLQAVAQDPELRRLRMIAEPWDIGPGGYQLGRFPAPWREWNDRFRDDIRRFWRGDSGLLGAAATRLAGSTDIFGSAPHQPSRSINFVTAHDGFTLADLVSFENKRNDANGEANRDGTSDNHSWNHGVEGPTEDAGILAARGADIRALLATLLLSRGTPMLTMGDERGRTQRGNNNGYAQDNPISWMDWTADDQGLFGFVSRLVVARRGCPALTSLAHLTGETVDDSLRPDVAWLRPDGQPMGLQDWQNPEHRTLIADLYRPAEDETAASRALVVLHAGRNAFTLVLPPPREGFAWRRVIDTASPDAAVAGAEGTQPVAARAVLLFIEEPAELSRKRESSASTSERLAELAVAAGLTHDWWDISGTNHLVPDTTKRKLLAAMGLPADSRDDVEDSLHSLSRRTVLRALPATLVAEEGRPVRLPLGTAIARLDRAVALLIQREDGSRHRVVVTPQTGALSVVSAPDGRQASIRTVELPPQPLGRHQLMWIDGPEPISCHLTITPAQCYLPPALQHGGRRFGLAAHLYTLRRDGDQGIGDFTTLARIGAATAAKGGSVVGLNPLHVLFCSDRSLTSPYSPSDRRFLDPIYVDVTALPHLPDHPAVRAALAEQAAIFAAARLAGEVDYPTVWTAKETVLRASFDAIAALRDDHPAQAEFAAFKQAQGASLACFAQFEAISAARRGAPWRSWPEALQRPDSEAVRDFVRGHAAEVDFACFLQWLADAQLADAAAVSKREGLSIGFYRDFAVGTSPDGAAAWAEQKSLMRGVSVGAPPDPFSVEGQNWMLPPANPLAWAADGYSIFAEMLQTNMRHAGALRIDHVLGLNRLFLIPEGVPPAEGSYLAFPLADLLGNVALESQRAECIVVGEDLGTVPDGVRETLAARSVLSYRVLWFERDGEHFKPPSSYPAQAAACVSTHDLPTIAGWWAGEDIDERVGLGFSDAAAAEAARTERRREKAQLLEALAANGLAPAAIDLDAPLSAALNAAIHSYVAATPCLLDLVQADDLAAETVPINLPGTDRERPNWRRKIRVGIEGIWETEAADLILRDLTEQGRTFSSA
jgi:glycogen debranching enzyme GlgX/4-alpha-glucanotransferase